MSSNVPFTLIGNPFPRVINLYFTPVMVFVINTIAYFTDGSHQIFIYIYIYIYFDREEGLVYTKYCPVNITKNNYEIVKGRTFKKYDKKQTSYLIRFVKPL